MAIVRAAWQRSGLTQRELAARVGISQGQLSKAMRGKATLTITEAAALCDILGLDLTAVVRESEPE